MSHKLGQVFLHDKNILKKIVSSASLSQDDVAVEIGCGHGVMTKALAECAKHLTVIEIDESCIQQTKENLGEHLTILYIHADVLKDRFSSVLEPRFSVVANIPYYISAKILKLLIESRHRVDKAVLMVQKEFAKKLTAKPGDKDYTSLSVHVGFYFDVEELFFVSRTCFNPVPDVDSSVIRLIPKLTQYSVDETVFFSMVRTGFWGRRKPLVSALSKGPYLELDKAFKTCDFFKVNPDIRAEVMNLEQFYQLYCDIEPFVKRVNLRALGLD